MNKRYSIFVINLASATERKASIVSQLERLKLKYQLIDAVNGSSLPNDSNLIDWNWANANAYWVSKGALGCGLSHLNAYKMTVEQNLDFALILEDDSLLDKCLPEFLNKIGDYLRDGTILLVYYASRSECILSRKDAVQMGNYSLLKAENPYDLISANAYILTKQTCEKLIEYHTPLKSTSDRWGVFLHNNVIDNVYCVYPALADVFDYKSTIDYLSEKSLLGQFLNTVDHYKIFPLYSILKMLRRYKRRKMLTVRILD